jgi:hypothetical protein
MIQIISKCKSYLYTILITALVTSGVYTYILNRSTNKDAVKIATLSGENTKLNDSLKDQTAKNQILQAKVDQATTNVNNAHQVTITADNHLNSTPSTVNITPVKEVQEVKDAIAKNYNDSTVGFDGTRFNIIQPTVVSLTNDAIQWKVNGPILTTKLAATEESLDATRKENTANQTLVTTQTDLNNGLTNSNKLLTETNNNKDKQINLYEKDLKVQSMNGKIKFVLGIGIGGGGYWIYDHYIKK